MKRTIVLLVLILSILSSCGLNHDTPYKQYATMQSLSENLHNDFKIPYFVDYLNPKEHEVEYYISSVPPSGSVITGFLIVLKNLTQSSDYNTIELRGINIVKAGDYAVENWTENYSYICTIPEDSIKWNDKELFYSAYISKDSAVKNPFEVTERELTNYFDHFYVYLLDNDIRYSIAYMNFSVPQSISNYEKYLEKATSYFANFTLNEWY